MLSLPFKTLMHAIGLIALILSCGDRYAVAQDQGDAKYALVIGNSTYQHAATLGNPTYDASAVGASLQRLGFHVTTAENLTFDDMRRAILQFGRDARGADMSIIYFAGHGIEVEGEDWLVPIDADLQTDLDVDNTAINLKSMMKAVAGTRSLGLVILDACRTNPFQPHARAKHADLMLDRGMQLAPAPDRGLEPLDMDTGLAPVDPVDNVLVAFAAKDGTVAMDGQGDHSPFTSALLTHLETQGLEINFLFRNIRDDVLATTKNKQEPFIYGSLSKESIYLNPAKTPQIVGPPIGGDAIAWAFLKNSSDINSLRTFTQTFPASSHITEAQARIDSILHPRLDWQALYNPLQDEGRTTGPLEAMAAETEPTADDMAKRFTHDSPAVDSAWSVIKTAKDPSTIEHFVSAFPTSRRKAMVRPPHHAPTLQNAATRSADVGRLPTSAAEIPWTPSDGDNPGIDNQLLGVFSNDYAVRGDRRARACDRLAADPDDADHAVGIPGADFTDMNGPAALKACKAAVAAFPDVPRYRFQLCRALSKVGMLKEASAQCDAAVTASAAADRPAAYYITFENINNIQGLSPSAGRLPPPISGSGPPTGLIDAARQVGMRENRSARILNQIVTQGIQKPGDARILGQVKSAVGETRRGVIDLQNGAGHDRFAGAPGSGLRVAARRFDKSATVLREGARLANTESRPVIARVLMRQAIAARALGRTTMLAARGAQPPGLMAPRVAPPRMMAPRLAQIRMMAPKIAPPRIMMPKIQIMIPHIMMKRP